MTLIDEIRLYVVEHDCVVTNSEVAEYILKERKIATTKETIRVELSEVLMQENGILKRSGLREEIRYYLMDQCNKDNKNITIANIIDFIYSQGYVVTEHHIRVAISQVSKEMGISLIKYKRREDEPTLKNAVRKYVIEHNKEITTEEVINYIMNETSIKTTISSIKDALHRVCKEQEIRVKRTGLREKIREYLLEQDREGNKDLTYEDVVKFIYSQGYENPRNSICSATASMSTELGIELKAKKYERNRIICVKEH